MPGQGACLAGTANGKGKLARPLDPKTENRIFLGHRNAEHYEITQVTGIVTRPKSSLDRRGRTNFIGAS